MVKLRRQVLKEALQIVKPALSSDDFIPVMTCFCFNDDFVYAYDNVLGIAWPLKTSVTGAVVGDALLKVVSSFTAKDIELSLSDDNFLLKGGRSNFKSVLMPSDRFVLDPSTGFDVAKTEKVSVSIKLSKNLLEGIDKCLLSVGDDPLHAAHMGLSVESNGRSIKLYSTDNRSLSRFCYNSKSKKFVQRVLPTRFCRQLVVMKDHLKDAVMDLSDDMVGIRSPNIFKGGKYVLFSKLLHLGEMTDFEKVIQRYSDKDLKYFPVPSVMEGCLERALIVVSHEIVKNTEVTLSGNTITMHTMSSMGDANDRIVLRQIKLKSGTHNIITDLVLRACKTSDQMAFGDKAIAFKSGEGFLHLVTYRA